MDNYLPLTPSEIVADRPFTHPEQSAEDMAILRRMTDRLRVTVSQANETRPFTLELREADGRAHRLVIASPKPLLAHDDLSAVGFFGQKRANADAAPLNAIDAELIGEFPQHPGVLSYCSLELADGNWGNLVMLKSSEAREHWRTSARHAYAVRDLAPGYYATLRLHNAALLSGLFSGRDLILHRTKYYDFRGATPWHAVREIHEA